MRPYYQDRDVTIYHGRCEDVLPSIVDVAFTFTSPPYNTLGSRIPKKPSGMWGRRGGGLGFVESINDSGYADDVPEDEYQQQQNEVGAMLARASKPGASLYYNHKCRWRDGVILHPVLWFRPDGWNLRSEIVWNRARSMTLNARMWAPSDERILWFTRPGAPHTWNPPNGPSMLSVWSISHESGKNKPHPVSFPVTLPSRAIAASSNPGDLVLDPYCGSGTTMVAARNLGRRSVGIEREERFCEVAARRLNQTMLGGVDEVRR